jgi:hypothetical protein
MKPIVCTTLIFLCFVCLSPAAMGSTFSTDVVFSKSGQNMWGGGDAFTLDKEWFLGVDPPAVGGTLVDLVLPVVNVGVDLYGRLDLKAGLDLGMKIDSGSVDISYPVRVNFSFPDTITEGELITMGSSYEVLGSASLNTTFPSITPKAEAVLKLDADLDFNVHYGFDEYGISLVNLHTDYRYDLLDALGIPTASGDSETYDLGFGSVEVTIPGDLDTVGQLAGNTLIAHTGEFAGEFLDARLNLLSLGELIPPPVGTAFKVFNAVESGHIENWDVFLFWLNWNMIDLDVGAIARITQDFEFVPEELLVDLYNNGTKLTSFKVGDPVEILIPEGGLNLTPVFRLDNTFTNETALRIDPLFHFLLVQTEGYLSIEDPLFGTRVLNHESLYFGPLYKYDWTTGGPEIPVYTKDFGVSFGQIQGDSFHLGEGGPIGIEGPNLGQVPEPGSLVLFASGLVALTLAVKMRRRK